MQIDDFKDLVEEYTEQMRRHCVVGGEFGYAHAFVDALTDPDSQLSNARRLQRVRAVTAAADRVRAERQEAAR